MKDRVMKALLFRREEKNDKKIKKCRASLRCYISI